MAGNDTQQLSAIERSSGVTNADLWAALDQLDVGSGAEETSAGKASEAEALTDIGHGAEVKGVEAEEESAGGENAGDGQVEADEAETGQEEADDDQRDAGLEEEEEVAESAAEETEDEEPPQPKGIREMEKRIGKLTARNKGLEEHNASLQEQLQKAQPITLQPNAEDPLAHLNSEQEVIKAVQQLRDLRDWCEENFDGGELPTKDGVQERSAAEVRQMKVRCRKMLEAAPARLEYLAKKTRYEVICKEVYPELFDAKSIESQIAWNFVNENPGILRLPNFALIIGDAIRGGKLREQEEQARQARQAATVKPAVRPTLGGQKLAPRAISPAAAKSVRSNGASQLHQRFLETGSKKDLEAYLTRTLGG